MLGHRPPLPLSVEGEPLHRDGWGGDPLRAVGCRPGGRTRPPQHPGVGTSRGARHEGQDRRPRRALPRRRRVPLPRVRDRHARGGMDPEPDRVLQGEARREQRAARSGGGFRLSPPAPAEGRAGGPSGPPHCALDGEGALQGAELPRAGDARRDRRAARARARAGARFPLASAERDAPRHRLASGPAHLRAPGSARARPRLPRGALGRRGVHANPLPAREHGQPLQRDGDRALRAGAGAFSEPATARPFDPRRDVRPGPHALGRGPRGLRAAAGSTDPRLRRSAASRRHDRAGDA